MMLKILSLTLGVVVILVAAAVAPDVKRYMRIRSM